jgi:hypothetical protein
MGTKMLYQVFETMKPKEEVLTALEKSFMVSGGQVSRYGNSTIKVINGKEGVQFGFSADFDATVTVNQKDENKFDVVCNITWKMNSLSWISLIVGIFVFGVLWIIPLLYLFIDPASAYNRFLMMAANQIGCKNVMPMMY